MAAKRLAPHPPGDGVGPCGTLSGVISVCAVLAGEEDDTTVGRLLPVFRTNREYLVLARDITEGAEITADLVRAHLRAGAQFAGGRSLLLLADGEVVGTASLLVPHPREPYPWIGLLLVHGERQRHGLGGRAVAVLEEGLAAEGWPEVRIGVLDANARGLAFWTALGYVRYDARPDSEGRPCQVLRKVLAAPVGTDG